MDRHHAQRDQLDGPQLQPPPQALPLQVPQQHQFQPPVKDLFQADLTLQKILAELKSTASEDQQERVAVALKEHLEFTSREVSFEQASVLLNAVNKVIYALVSSPLHVERMGGILAIEQLIDFKGEETISTTVRFANYLRKVIPGTDVEAMKRAARALGRLAALNNALIPDLVDYEVKRAMEWLQETPRHANRRHAAVLIILNLTMATQSLIYNSHINVASALFSTTSVLFDQLWTAVYDDEHSVRETAAAALGATFDIIRSRENDERQAQVCDKLMDETMRGLGAFHKNNDPSKLSLEFGVVASRLHGALLVAGELLRIAPDQLTQQHVSDLHRILLMHRSHPELYIRVSIMRLIPPLVSASFAFRTSDCQKDFLPSWMPFLLAAASDNRSRLASVTGTGIILGERGKKETFDIMERMTAFQVIGSVAAETTRPLLRIMALTGESAQSALSPYYDRIFPAMKSVLATKRFRPMLERGVFECLGMAVQAEFRIAATQLAPGRTEVEERVVDRIFRKYMIEGGILDLIFEGHMTENLTALVTSLVNGVADFLPPETEGVRREIETRLLNKLSIILSRKPYVSRGSVVNQTHDIRGESSPSVDVILVCLRTLGEVKFAFAGIDLIVFVKDAILQYLDYEDTNVRREAATNCAKVLANNPVCAMHSANAIQLVHTILERLVGVGIADSEPSVRLPALQALDPNFDPHLAQAHVIHSIFAGLNDEVLAVRETALAITARLMAHNPGVVMPLLRKLMIQVLTELGHSASSRAQVESARLMSSLIAVAPSLLIPYAETVFDVLIPKIQDGNSRVAAGALDCLATLSRIRGKQLTSKVDLERRLVLLLIGMLEDQGSSAKRGCALNALGHVLRHTGFVVTPYEKYPGLYITLMQMLKSEMSPSIRRDVITLIGVIGAVDPYVLKDKVKSTEAEETKSSNSDVALLLAGGDPSSEDYYPTVAINALARVLRDPTLSVHHQNIFTACMYLFDTLGIKCAPFLSSIIPPVLNVMRTQASDGLLDFYFQQLARVVNIMMQHMKPYLDDLIALIQQHWNSYTTPALQSTIIALLGSLASLPDVDFKPYISQLLPDILNTLEVESAGGVTNLVVVKTLQAVSVFGGGIEAYLHLVIPTVTKLFDEDKSMDVRNAAVTTVYKLATKHVYLADHASSIVHSLIRLLDRTTDDSHQAAQLQKIALDTLAVLLQQMGVTFRLFVPTLDKILVKRNIRHHTYQRLTDKLLRDEPLVDCENFAVFPQDESNALVLQESLEAESRSMKSLPVNQHTLKRAWEASQHSTKEDWVNWFRHLNVQLLRESPSHALRACGQNASVYYPLARELFNVAFVSCWSKLTEDSRVDLMNSLKIATHSPTLPPEILQILLNLAEYMERVGSPLPLDTGDLSSLASNSHAYAKALHYKETEFLMNPTRDALEELITINTELQLPDAAVGLLNYAQKELHFESKEAWYERLHHYEDALLAYNRKMADGIATHEVMLGRMRCLNALSRWEDLANDTPYALQTFDDPADREKILEWAAGAAWGLQDFAGLAEFSSMMRDSSNRFFYRALLAIHSNQLDLAGTLINECRSVLDADLTAMVGESYHRGYSDVVRAQILAELEEYMFYKQSCNQPGLVEQICEVWSERLKGCQPDVEVWQRIIRSRRLVIPPRDDVDVLVRFANLCRRTGKFSLSAEALYQLMGHPGTVLDPLVAVDLDTPPKVKYAYLKLAWAGGRKRSSLEAMVMLTRKLEEAVRADTKAGGPPECAAAAFQSSGLIKLMARTHFKQGNWKMTLDDFNDLNTAEILLSYQLATQYDPNWYKACHAWALANYEVVARKEQSSHANIINTILPYIVASIQGFIRSITLSTEQDSTLQVTLRLLTVLFRFGYRQEVIDVITDGIKAVSIDTWLQVIPQLIARIHIPTPKVRRFVQQLLVDVGTKHAQAIIFPLAVSSQAQSAPRKAAASAVMERLRAHQALLVEQALLVSHELVRVAVLWPEMWFVALEAASRHYYGEHNFDAMCAVLEPLHQLLENKPTTLKEVAFDQAFGRDLEDAQAWCDRYRQTGDSNDVEHAWRLYGNVYNQIKDQVLPTLSQIDLQSASPRLLAARDLQLAVPGTYRVGRPPVLVRCFSPILEVLRTKQKPRRLTVEGSNGRIYPFLLKGHEDLRQDERVMQLFGLVNALLRKDTETSRRHLGIQKYPVVPLSTNSGLIGWVEQSDTLHDIILRCRENRRIRLNAEHVAMIRMLDAPVHHKNNMPDMTAGDRMYNQLTMLQKAEVFERGLAATDGQDLSRILWYKSLNSEAWLERRTNYTRSLAVMSMVGYILGLGDRHPSNLMIQRTTGNVVHIDFGDCFEVAMQREKFPERIPFRLTRVLVNAMEVAAIHGSFKATCEHVLRVLRSNKESVMAVLEAFIFDPLLSWHLWSDARQDVSDHAEQADDTTITRPEVMNQKAVAIVHRIQSKLTGRDFSPSTTLSVPLQVEKLIQQATSTENLCQCYVGWCAFW